MPLRQLRALSLPRHTLDGRVWAILAWWPIFESCGSFLQVVEERENGSKTHTYVANTLSYSYVTIILPFFHRSASSLVQYIIDYFTRGLQTVRSCILFFFTCVSRGTV
jgi:hypothetical protein